MIPEHYEDSPNHSLSIEEAAEHLNVSPATIRRRIKTGEVGAFKRPTAYGFEWRIVLDGKSPALNTSLEQPMVNPDQNIVERVDQASPEVMKLLEMLESERRSRDALEHRNEQLAGQVGFLQAKLQDAERQIALLSAPAEEAPSIAEPAPAAVPRRPWWKRILGGT